MNTLRRCITSNSLLSRLFQEKRTSVRFLYNEQLLGMDRYIEGRQRTLSRLGSVKENFYNRMRSQISNPTPSLIFTEDLKTVIHTCDDNPDDIELCIQMMKRFHKQNKELRFGTFVFGPVAMRLFYYLKKEDIMKEFFKDPELDGFFDQLKSYHLSMDMYFKKGLYQDILDSFAQLQAKNLAETKFPREAMILTAGACYKLNTPETYEYAASLITQAREARADVLRKALVFVVALAVNQKKPDVALEIMSSIDRFNNTTANNLKLMAYAQLDRIHDAFDILRRLTDQDSPSLSRIRGGICESTLDLLKQSVEKANDKELSHIFEQLCRSLKESNTVTTKGIDELVCLPIEPRPFFRESDAFSNQQRSRFPDEQRSRFPDAPFRARERENFNRDEDFPPRRRSYAGLSDD